MKQIQIGPKVVEEKILIFFWEPKLFLSIYNVQYGAWYNDITSFSIEMIALKFVPLAKDRVAAAYKKKIHKTTE